MPLLNTCAACGATYTGRACPKCPDGSTSAGPVFEPDPPPLLAPGQMFRGLEIVDELGRGGMGIVYKARQPALNRCVALKILPPERSRFVEFGSRFEREARALAALAHPNIVTIYDFGKEPLGSSPGGGDLYFFSMEMVEGKSLRGLMQEGKLPIGEILRLSLQICDALQFAHKQGVVHRDIKPDNILLDKEGRVKVADFGLAKLARSDDQGPMLTETNAVMGTAAYMAPEQMERTKDVDHRADIYSIGVMLYEMLTGRRPLGRFDPPSKISKCDAQLDAIVLKSLAREAEERYQSVAEMRADLERLASGARTEPVVAAAKSGSKKWIFGVLFPLILGGSLVAWRVTRPKPKTPPGSPTSPAEAVWTELRTLEGHYRPVDGVAFSPDGKLLASVSRGEYIKLWDIGTGKDVGTLSGNPACVAISPDGKYIASGTKGGGVVLWDLGTRKEAKTITQYALGVDAVVFSPDGALVASSSRSNVIRICRVSDGALVHELEEHERICPSIAFSPDGSLLASGSADTTIRLWSVATGNSARTLTGSGAAVVSVAFSPDGKTLASGGADKTIRIWSVADGTCLRTLTGHTGSINCVAFHPGGRLLASAGGDKTLRFWDVVEFRELRSVEAHSPGVLYVAFSRDGSLLASAGGDNLVKLWAEK